MLNRTGATAATRVESGRPACRTLGELLCERAQAHPERAFTRFDPQTPDADLTYGGAWTLACRWAALFESFGMPPGRPILLALPNGADFVGAFFGASLAGFVPAPSIPRRSMDLAAFRSFLIDRVNAINAAIVVTTPEQDVEELPDIQVVTASSLPRSGRNFAPSVNSDNPGLLQFTSATGGRSKGVQLSQRALLFQASAIAKAVHFDPASDVAVSWLPLFHDMGLVGFLLTPAAFGATVFLLRTEAFAARPTIWMDTISRERGTITSGPPSAYALASRFAARRAENSLDLRSVRVAFVGAERIMPATLQAIHAGLGPAGLSWSSIMPAYGMAEIGLAATITPLGRGPRWHTLDMERLQRNSMAVPVPEGGHGVVGCGVPVESTLIQIVDEEGCPVADRHVGQIMIKSPSLLTGHLLGGKIDTSCIRRGWLMTGDRGYLDAGELFVTGRMGEVLHIGGAKYSPEEFEEAVLAVDRVRGGRVAAVGRYSAETSTETATLIVETVLADLESRDKCRLEIRRALMQRSLPVGDVVFVPPKTLERTPNGKLPRAKLRERLLRGEFDFG